MIKKYFLFSLICLIISLNTFAQSYQLNAFNNVIYFMTVMQQQKQLLLLLELFV